MTAATQMTVHALRDEIGIENLLLYLRGSIGWSDASLVCTHSNRSREVRDVWLGMKRGRVCHGSVNKCILHFTSLHSLSAVPSVSVVVRARPPSFLQ
eukprot:GHVU01187965.1.p1 GENE.GHVU01187965.1~~GHVU01187965.1.p1  ORF type:complete len:108 (+),score=1.26 GHVU01187965.1:34-324(+)